MKLLTEGDRTKWLEARRLGLGSSDAPVLVGVSRRKSLLELYAEKTGLASSGYWEFCWKCGPSEITIRGGK